MALPHIRDATPLPVLLQLPHIRDATLGWGGVGWDVNVHKASNCLDSTSGRLEEKNAERHVDGKVKPSSSETPIFASKLTFRYGETMNLCSLCGR